MSAAGAARARRLAAAALVAGALALPAPSATQQPGENPHDFQRVGIGCNHCHVLVPGQGRGMQRTVFRKNIDDLCQECHAAALEDNLNHRVGIRPSMRVPEDLHLNARGEISCITCHDPHAEYISSRTHSRTYFLRRRMLKRELCLACHGEGNYEEPRVSVELVAPANNAVVEALPVPLIGRVSEASVAEVTLEVNDTRRLLSVRDRAFSSLVTLAEGINSVRVGGEGIEPVVLNILYNPALPKEMTYRLYRSHGMADRRDCFACHDEKGRGWAIPGDDADLCARCHDPLTPGRFLHGPVAIGSCTVCHDPHGQTNPAFLVRAGEQLCFQCHMEGDVLQHLVGEGGAAFLRQRGCTYCHDPHTAERKYLLRAKG